MIKAISNFLTKEELALAQEYWKLSEINPQNSHMVPSLFSKGSIEVYADILSEVFLQTKKHLVEEVFGEELYPTYTYSRMYYKGCALKKHNDRPSCEVSVTLNIFGDKDWPIWFWKLKSLNGKIDESVKPSSIITNPGDAAVYEGGMYDHWREEYTGEKCMQIFLHYVRKNGNFNRFKLDGRDHLGQYIPESKKNIWSNKQ